jgi:hypothetical protein
MLLGGDVKVVLHKIENELIQLTEELKISIDKDTLEINWFSSDKADADECTKIIIDVARRYYCGYAMSSNRIDSTPADAISLTPPSFQEKISITIRSVWLPT